MSDMCVCVHLLRCVADVHVDRALSTAIQQARLAKKMTQKQLATAMNEKPQVIAEYESGKAIPVGVRSRAHSKKVFRCAAAQH